jgi:AcrR family transcriptional regulator
MARQSRITDEELLSKLSTVFRDVGYNGASMQRLSEAAGLKKASLYHRFPGGKEQMACEVLIAAHDWLTHNILEPLRGEGSPEARIRAMAIKIDEFYEGGRQACLLNLLSSARIEQGPFSGMIKAVFEAWIDAITAVLTDAKTDANTAQQRAERGLALLHGSLVLSRGMGTVRPFKTFIKTLRDELLG